MKTTIFFFLLLSSTMSVGQNYLEGSYDSQKDAFIQTNGTTINDFRSGLSPYSAYVEGDYLYGVIDTTGKIIVEPKYYEIEGFAGGISRVTQKAEPWEITYGFIDVSGKEVLPPVYTDTDDWFYRSMRLAEVLVVGKDGKYGVFDYSGKKLTPLKYQSIWNFYSGYARVYVDGKSGFIDKEGNEVIPCIYEEAKDFAGDKVLVKKNGKYGWINAEGKTIIPFEYESASNFIGGQAKVKKNGKMIYIDEKGQAKLPATYEGVGYYKEGLAWARKGDKWGFIDTAGKVVIPFTYKKVGNFQNGRAWVWKDDKWGHIDQTGKVTTPIIYDRTGDFSSQYTGDSLFASVTFNGKYGKVGVNGNVVIPFEYIGIDHFSGGMAKVRRQGDGTRPFGFVNYAGEEVIPCMYEKAERFKEGSPVAAVCKDGRWGLINKEGEIILPCEYFSISDKNDGTYQVWNGQERFVVDGNGSRVKE